MVPQPTAPALSTSDGEACAARCNALATGYDRDTIEQALALAELAHRVHGLSYYPGRSRMADYPPDRFEWVCSTAGGDVSVEVIEHAALIKLGFILYDFFMPPPTLDC